MRGKVEESVVPNPNLSKGWALTYSALFQDSIQDTVQQSQLCPSPAAQIVSIFYISTYFAYSTCTAGLATSVSTDKHQNVQYPESIFCISVCLYSQTAKVGLCVKV